MVHVIRIYYTMFDDEKHRKIVKNIIEIAKNVEEKQSWVKEFRHIEIDVGNQSEEDCSGLQRKIRELLERELGGEYLRIDHIRL